MISLLDQIDETYAEFVTDSKKSEEGNKAAGVRARKAAMKLRKLLTTFKKESLEQA